MTPGRNRLDQIERGLDGVTAGPERIWLQSYEDTTEVGEDRLWCEDKVWPDSPEDHEPTEYVRADLFRDREALLAEYRDHSQPYWEARATAAEATVTALQEKLKVAEEALEPFADLGNYVLAEAPPKLTMFYVFTDCDEGHDVKQVSLEYLRRARTALSQIRSKK